MANFSKMNDSKTIEADGFEIESLNNQVSEGKNKFEKTVNIINYISNDEQFEIPLAFENEIS